MQIAIPLIESINDNIELRYALRGVEKYLSGVSGITIIGHKPTWLQNVTHVPHEPATTHEWKEKNIYDKLCKMRGKFLYMNDDHFLLSPYVARKFPFYYDGTLQDRLNKCSNRHAYAQTVRNTIDAFGRESKFYDIHCPVIMEQKYFWQYQRHWFKQFGLCFKTLYIRKPFPIEYSDLKLNASFDINQLRSMTAGRLWFSTSEQAWNNVMFEFMEEIYPLKSKYEK